jgi:hypothetical protein
VIRGKLFTNPGLLNPSFIKIDDIWHGFDFAGPIGTAHGGQRILEEFLTGRRKSFLNEFAIPLVGPHLSRQQNHQATVNRSVVGFFKNNLLDGSGFDAQVHAKEPIQAPFIILGVARWQRAVSFYVVAFRQEAGKVKQAGGSVGKVGRGQTGQHFAGGAGDWPGGHGGAGR